MILRGTRFGLILGYWFALSCWVTGCAGSAGRLGSGAAAQALPPHMDVAAFRQRLGLAQLPLAQLHANVRLMSFGPEGRLRGRAEIYVQRPDHMRYALLGPQASPLVVLACDGQSLRGVDLRQRRYVVGPADAEQFDAWLSPVHLRLDARGWVRLLMGELEVPPDAAPAQGAPKDCVALRWAAPARRHIWAAFGQDDARLREARLCQDGALRTRIWIEQRGAQGVPERLRIEHVQPGGEGVQQIELSLQDIDTTSAHPSDVYSLMPPAGFAIIGPSAAP